MARKLEASGQIRRSPAPSDGRATLVELTDSGRALAEEVKQLWRTLAEETVAGLADETVAGLPAILTTMTTNVAAKRSRASNNPV
jgi:DNA-binding MarR family transcriptional regulator